MGPGEGERSEITHFILKSGHFSGVSLRYLYPLGLCPSNWVWCTLQSVLRRMRRENLKFKAHRGLKLCLARFFLDRRTQANKRRAFLRAVSTCLVPSSLRRPQLPRHTSPSPICRVMICRVAMEQSLPVSTVSFILPGILGWFH